MARTIEQLRSGATVGHAKLGLHGQMRGSVAQQVHDGDTVVVDPVGNLALRFLGVDAPEVSFTQPGQDRFVPLSDPVWEPFLADPFAPDLPPFDPPLEPGLEAHLNGRVGPAAAANHARLATAATQALEAEVEADLSGLEQSIDEFTFFLSFAREVMDRYGRLLCYLNREQSSATTPGPRPRSYNERLLAAGWVTPYFIWPNINPFRRAEAMVAAVPAPGTAGGLADREASLRDARRSVREARGNQVGLYETEDPLRLLPFELRFLARRQPPDRWVIDLGANDDVLVPPQAYFEITHPEDRLFVPAEYVPLFVEAGWHRG